MALAPSVSSRSERVSLGPIGARVVEKRTFSNSLILSNQKNCLKLHIMYVVSPHMFLFLLFFFFYFHFLGCPVETFDDV